MVAEEPALPSQASGIKRSAKKVKHRKFSAEIIKRFSPKGVSYDYIHENPSLSLALSLFTCRRRIDDDDEWKGISQ